MGIAIITGASSGMGREFALLLDEEGLEEIWVLARRKDKLEELPLKTKTRVLAMDLTDSKALEEYRCLLETERPRVTWLVNCSGFGKFGDYTTVPLGDSMNMIDLNCKALVWITESTIPFMERGSRIVELDSESAFQPVPYLNVYAATKAFVLSYSRGLQAELRHTGITVTAVCPGWVQTEFFDRAKDGGDKQAITYFVKYYQPRDVVRAAIRDAKKGKQVSVYGALVRTMVTMVKLLPVSFTMKVWLKQQKHT